MTVFIATLEQTGFLFLFILMGYLLARKKLIPDNSQAVLSKLENYVFIPALVLSTFIGNFTPEKLTVAAELLLGSLGLGLIAIVLSRLQKRTQSRDNTMAISPRPRLPSSSSAATVIFSGVKFPMKVPSTRAGMNT